MKSPPRLLTEWKEGKSAVSCLQLFHLKLLSSIIMTYRKKKRMHWISISCSKTWLHERQETHPKRLRACNRMLLFPDPPQHIPFVICSIKGSQHWGTLRWGTHIHKSPGRRENNKNLKKEKKKKQLQSTLAQLYDERGTRTYKYINTQTAPRQQPPPFCRAAEDGPAHARPPPRPSLAAPGCARRVRMRTTGCTRAWRFRDHASRKELPVAMATGPALGPAPSGRATRLPKALRPPAPERRLPSDAHGHVQGAPVSQSLAVPGLPAATRGCTRRQPSASRLRQRLLNWLHFCLKYGPRKRLRAITAVLSAAASQYFGHAAHGRCGGMGLMAAVLPCLRLLLLARS